MIIDDSSFFICIRVCNAAAAIEFYQRAFDATEVFRVHGDQDRLVHAQVDFGGHRISLTDEFPEWGAFAPKPGERLPMAIHLRVADADEALVRALEAGAHILRPLEDQPYGERRAILIDPFGYEWVIRQRIEALSPNEIELRLRSLG